MNKNRLTATLTESLVLGALTHNLEWMELQGIALRKDDFAIRDNQVLYSIMRDRLLERNMEVTSDQLILEAEKHPIDNNISIEYARNLREKVGAGVSFDTFKKEAERLNKLRVLRDLNDEGFDVSGIIGEDSINAPNIIDVIDDYSFESILNFYRGKVDTIEASLGALKDKSSITADMGLRDLILEMQETPQVGALLDGDYFNVVVRGALFSRYYLNSAASGVGKTRMKLGNAALLAYPRIMEDGTVVHREEGYSPVLFVTTEVSPAEIQTMLVASVSGVEEEKIKEGTATFDEEARIELALQFIESNRHFYIEQIPDPTVAATKSIIEKHIRRNGVQYVFYDYIFGSAGINSEFRSGQREDVVLMYLSNTLKEIATINDVFIMSSTQVNGSWMEAKVRNQNLIRGSKAIADKADVGMITIDITEEELLKVQPICDELGVAYPTMVTDVYKNRGGRYTSIKLFRIFDKGTCRMKDLFMTDEFHTLITPRQFYEEETKILSMVEAKEVLVDESDAN